MEDTFVTIDTIAELWGFNLGRVRDAGASARTAVWAELGKIKGASPRQNPSGAREAGLTAKQFERADALRKAFYTASAAKPAPPPVRKSVTADEFSKIKAAARANGFLDLWDIGRAWGMKWSKVLEELHYLDPDLKDCVRLVPDGIEGQLIAIRDRCGLYPEEFNRLNAIRIKLQSDQDAEQQARNAAADAETQRLEVENELYKQAKAAAFEVWDTRLKVAKGLVEEEWDEYYYKVKISRGKRDTLIEAARAACSDALDPLKREQRIEIADLGDEPPDGPRFSRESEIWWTYQHAKNAVSSAFEHEAGIYLDVKREDVEDARTAHRRSVWKWRKELDKAIKPLKKEAYKIFKKGSVPVDRAEFDLKSRV